MERDGSEARELVRPQATTIAFAYTIRKKTHSISFIDGHRVRDTVTRVKDNTSCATRGVQRENGLNGNVKGGRVERLKHNLSHLFSVGLWVEGSLCAENGMLFRSNTELIVKGVVPVAERD